MSSHEFDNDSYIDPSEVPQMTTEQVTKLLREMKLYDLSQHVFNMLWTGEKTLKYKTVLRAVNPDEYQVFEEYLASNRCQLKVRRNFVMPKKTFCLQEPIRLGDNYHYIYQENAPKLANILSLEGNAGIYGLHSPRFSGKTTFLLQLIPFLELENLEVACIAGCSQFNPKTFAELGQKAMSSIARMSSSSLLCRDRAREWLALDDTSRTANFLEFLCDGDFQGKKVVILWDDIDFISDKSSIIESISSMFRDLQEGFAMGGYPSFRALVLCGSHQFAFDPFGIAPRIPFEHDFLKLPPITFFEQSFHYNAIWYCQEHGLGNKFLKLEDCDENSWDGWTAGHAGTLGIIGHVLEANKCQTVGSRKVIRVFDTIVEALYEHPIFRCMEAALNFCDKSESTKKLLFCLCARSVKYDPDSVEQANLLRIGLATMERYSHQRIYIHSDLIRILSWKSLAAKEFRKQRMDIFTRAPDNWVWPFDILCELLGHIRPEIIATCPRGEFPLTEFSIAIAEAIYHVPMFSMWTAVPTAGFNSIVLYDKSSVRGYSVGISFCDYDSNTSKALSDIYSPFDDEFCPSRCAVVIIRPTSKFEDGGSRKRPFDHYDLYELYYDYEFKNARLTHSGSHTLLKDGKYIPYRER